MKKIIASLSLVFVLNHCIAQDRFTTAITKGISMMDSAATPKAYLETANHFERIANAEPSQWLAQYYTGLCLIYVAYDDTKPAEEKDMIYDKAMLFADRADKLKPASSEVLALKGYVTFMKMSVAPQSRAMTMIPASNTLIEKAIQLDPENPRAYLMKGQNLFYTPEAFGGGKAKAAAVLAIALAKYDSQSAKGIEPSWGRRRCNNLLQQSKQ